MASQQKNPHSSLISNLWGNWVNLDPAQRAAVASQLGTVGNILSIAANVHKFANTQMQQPSNPASDETPRPNQGGGRHDDDDVIEVEFEEVKK